MEHSLTCKQVAKILGLYHETVKEMIRDGRLKKMQVSMRNVRVRTEDLQKFIDERRE